MRYNDRVQLTLVDRVSISIEERFYMKEKDSYCPFCDLEVLQTRSLGVYGSVVLVYPNKPIIPQHVLVIPRRHVSSLEDISAQESVDIFEAYRLLKRVFKEIDGYTGANFFANDGKEAGQHVPHVHFHFFSRSQHEPKDPYDVLKNIKSYPVDELDSTEISHRIDRIKKALESQLVAV